MSISGFQMNTWVDELNVLLAKIDGHVDEAEYFIKVDDNDGFKDEDYAKFSRDNIRHVLQEDTALSLEFARRKLDHIVHRVFDARRRNDWVSEEIEEHEAKVGMTVAEDGTDEQRKEIKDGLRDRG